MLRSTHRRQGPPTSAFGVKVGFCRKFSPSGCRVYDPTTGSAGWMVTIAFKGSHFERDVILWGVRWYVAYPLSYRQIEEMMEERGVEVDHSTLNRWVLKICAGF
jgi:hypothetical protein